MDELSDIVDVVINVEEVEAKSRKSLLSTVEIDTNRMFAIAGLHPFQNKFWKYAIPIFVNAVLVTACFSPLWYPAYYIHQTEIWTAHLVILIPCYNYLVAKRYKWTEVTFCDHNDIRKAYRNITLTFYCLFMSYYVYFACYMIYFNREKPWPYQIGNALMALAWYFFFSISSATYYFTATTFLQKALFIKKKIKTLKLSNNLGSDFFLIYDGQFKSLRRFNNVWNRIVFIVLVVLCANIPIDTIAVLVKKAYFDIPGIVIKLFAVFWYLITICKLNHMELFTTNYLRKHHYLQDRMEEIESYIRVRPIGVNFFGIKITYEYLAKLLLIGVNLLLPTIYGLVTNNIL
jgi:hypothetical protein